MLGSCQGAKGQSFIGYKINDASGVISKEMRANRVYAQ